MTRTEKAAAKRSLRKDIASEKGPLGRFVAYLLDLYGRDGVWPLPGGSMARAEAVDAAVALRLGTAGVFQGDSVDREIARDIVLVKRGARDVEHAVDIRRILGGTEEPTVASRGGGGLGA